MTPEPPLPSNRSVAFTIAVSLGLLAAWLAWTGRGLAWLPGLGAALLAIAGAAVPGALTPLTRAWMGLAALLHRIVSPIALAVVYFGVITPYAFVMRLAGRDALRRRRDPAAASYWIERAPPGPDAGSFPRQY